MFQIFLSNYSEFEFIVGEKLPEKLDVSAISVDGDRYILIPFIIHLLYLLIKSYNFRAEVLNRAKLDIIREISLISNMKVFFGIVKFGRVQLSNCTCSALITKAKNLLLWNIQTRLRQNLYKILISKMYRLWCIFKYFWDNIFSILNFFLGFSQIVLIISILQSLKLRRPVFCHILYHRLDAPRMHLIG